MVMEDERYAKARSRVRRMRAFYTSLGTFVIVNITLFLINLVTHGDWWFYWVTIFWGIGLLWQAWGVFGPAARFGDDWEERKIQEDLRKNP